MLLRRLSNDSLAQASYLIGCAATGAALVVDPNRDREQYLDLAAREGPPLSAYDEVGSLAACRLWCRGRWSRAC